MRRVAIVSLILAIGGLTPLLAQPTVDTLNDVVGSNCTGSFGTCSLREAITVAAPMAVIDFDPALFPGTLILDPSLGPLVVDKQLVIMGPLGGGLAIEANGTHRVLEVRPSGNLHLFGATLRGGNSRSGGVGGGGVLNEGNLELVACEITLNNGFSPNTSAGQFGDGEHGGGIYNDGGATLLLVDSRVHGNIAGRGSRNFLNPQIPYVGGHGGALYNEGQVTIEDSTIQDNEAGGTDSILDGDGGFGGGIYNAVPGSVVISRTLVSRNQAGDTGNTGGDSFGGGIFTQGPLQVINSTIEDNSSLGSPGGGILVDDVLGATVRLENVTVANNSSGSGGDGVHQLGTQGAVTARNSLLADNGVDCAGSTPAWISEGYNLVGNASSCAGVFINNDQVGTSGSPLDPQLGGLFANGGPTETLALLAGSPAIDAANPSGCNFVDPLNGTDTALATDQRGESRPFDGDLNGTDVCDIGAYELHPVLRTLTVDIQGSGSGTVVSSVPGINCTTSCSADFVDGTNLDLTASSDPGSAFVQFLGDCTGVSCSLLMDADKMVDVEFAALHNVDVTVQLIGSAQGSVQSSPPGIDCGVDCDEDYLDGTSLTLSANPVGNAVLVRWGGDCTGQGACLLTVDAPKSVAAIFETPLFLDGFETGTTTAWSSTVP